MLNGGGKFRKRKSYMYKLKEVCAFSVLSVSMIALMPGGAAANHADSRVEFRDCPKCDKRIRIDLAAGKAYVNIDDGFFDGHGDDGVLRFHPQRFPNGMKPVVDGIHGMKATSAKIATVEVKTFLSAGVHTIRLFNDSEWMPDIDRMTIR